MAELRKDITWQNHDLAIEGGDFVVGPSLDQEVGLVLSMCPGHLKSDPVLGPSIIETLKSNSLMQIRKEIRIHLERDNKRLINIEIGDKITIEAEYK